MREANKRLSIQGTRKSIFSMDQPFLDAARVERNKPAIRKALPLGPAIPKGSGHTDGDYKNGWPPGNTVEVLPAERSPRNCNPVSQVEPGAEPLAICGR